MHIIITGCGRLGSESANSLAMNGHEIVVIDRDAKAFERLAKSFSGERILGHAIDQRTLEKAAIDTADAFIAVTGDDNLNIVSARIARETYSVPRVVSRILDPVRANIFAHLGVSTISTTAWAANRIKELITHRALDVQLSFGSGEVELVRVAVPVGLFGKTIESITIPGELSVAVITRHGRSFIPAPGASFEQGDIAEVLVSAFAIGKLEEFISAVV
ncbi:MAG: TrkA family potassium uptake protein [Actinobacteria bacterium]|nr:TrkA family potassium uptake protein [Actinomycetota bacterium]